MATKGKITAKQAGNYDLSSCRISGLNQDMVRPILVIQRCESLTYEQYRHLTERLVEKISQGGWLCLIIDRMDKNDVVAFGCPESRLQEFEELKKLIEQSKK